MYTPPGCTASQAVMIILHGKKGAVCSMRKSIRGVLCGVAAIGMLTSTISAADMTAYMAYRQNEVCLTGGEGIAIDSGTFTVSDLKITEGQDPDHRNDIGQVYTLDNGVFTFEVGRSGSETVADWFNEKFSLW